MNTIEHTAKQLSASRLSKQFRILFFLIFAFIWQPLAFGGQEDRNTQEILIKTFKRAKIIKRHSAWFKSSRELLNHEFRQELSNIAKTSLNKSVSVGVRRIAGAFLRNLCSGDKLSVPCDKVVNRTHLEDRIEYVKDDRLSGHLEVVLSETTVY